MYEKRISFVDIVREELKDAVAQAHGVGILTSYSDNSIRPNAAATRDEACVMVNRAIRRYAGERLPNAWGT